jgi:hypothetical protein
MDSSQLSMDLGMVALTKNPQFRMRMAHWLMSDTMVWLPKLA